MPAFSHELLHSALTARQQAPPHFSATSNTTTHDLQVICAWPVSGQYGPGSRVLYYVLVAACVFARKVDWLRNASLAGALLLPVVAALHGIVLAAVHNDHAVDMDVYGAFQLCAIGALAAPVTVRISQTYFNDPGRNTIFVWSCIVLAGLLSLTVEFYRLDSVPCAATLDDNNKTISTSPDLFPYGDTQCGLVCDETWPISPIRGGSANNIYVIPAPTRLAFNTATLLSAACCLPAILLCVWMWIKIQKDNTAKNAQKEKDASGDFSENIEGGEAPAVTVDSSTTSSEARIDGSPQDSNSDKVATGTEILVVLFGAAVLAVLFVGEWNLFSQQVSYQTEPIANIGQWQPIVGTGLVIFGSLYLLLAHAMLQERNSCERDESLQVKLTDAQLPGMDVYVADIDNGAKIITIVSLKDTDEVLDLHLSDLGIQSAAVENIMTGRTVPVVQYYKAKIGARCSLSLRLTRITKAPTGASRRQSVVGLERLKEQAEHRENQSTQERNAHIWSQGSRRLSSLFAQVEVMRPVARFMISVSDWMFTTKSLGNDELNQGKSAKYPTTPGEEFINPDLFRTRSLYGDRRNSDDSQVSRLSRQPSRPRSATAGSSASDKGSPDSHTPRSRRKDTIQTLASDAGTLGRRDTLDVPAPVSPLRSPTRSSQPTEDEILPISGGQITIMVSEDST